MGYRHLNIDERESILKMLSEQKNMTHVAELLGRNKGTISRELSRNRSLDPNDTIVFDSNSIEDPTVTITKAAASDVDTVRLTLTVNDGENPPVADTVTIDVYDTACLAAIGKGLSADNPADFDGNCITNFADLAVMAAKWLDDYALSGPIPKP